MNAVRVPWSHASFLTYLGGITILATVLALLSIESGQHGAGGFVLWSALVFAVLAALAFLAKRGGRLLTAGLFALSTVAAFVVFFGALLDWFGWLPDITDGSAFRGFRFWLLVLELSLVVTAVVALRIFRFPLLVFLVAAGTWFFVTDLLSGGGDWSAIVTIAYGLALLGVALGVDTGESRIYGFWLHVVAGLTIGGGLLWFFHGGLLWFFHDGDFDWIVIAIAAFAYDELGDRLLRSSWVVLAAWGLLQVTTHFAEKWAEVRFIAYFPFGFFLFPFLAFTESEPSGEHMWAGPLSYAVLGLAFIMIAQLLVRRHREAIPAAELL
jgi:hypothetical protein